MTALQIMKMTPAVGNLSRAMAAMETDKAIKIKEVFIAEAEVMKYAAAGANITADTARLLGNFMGGGGGKTYVHSDVSVIMDDRVVGHAIAKGVSDRSHSV